MTIGNNSGTVLKEVVDTIVDIENRLEDASEQRKAILQDMKKYKLPTAELIRLAKQDMDKAQDKAKKLLDAAGMLGVEVYASHTKPGAPTEFAEDVMDHARESVGKILGIDEDVRALKEDRKNELKKAKAAEFVPKIVELIVDIKRHPDGWDSHTEQSALVESYWNAIQ